MKYIQQTRGLFKTNVEFDLQDTGFQYIFTDKRRWQPPITEEEFIGYATITNQKVYATRNHPSADSRSSLRMTTIMMTIIFFFLVGFYRAGFQDTSVPIAYTILTIAAGAGLMSLWCYKILSEIKIIQVKNSSGGFFTVLKDEEGERIIEAIKKKRDEYLRKKYIDNSNYKNLTIESIEYLTSLNTITQSEATEFKKVVEGNRTESVGFHADKGTEV